ncbi:SMP-30/gluconolactonase/LRE family protein [Conexibacter sp. CPCC 206217]|uniref:SMP-30/gluconolactonase/LRE family protein n=1 Tax=Conexibacter sp. CPCC 206217 TaxID=3064574 RepID=UPI002721601D|nr:SMP-30/gluconolactonase/LRE family protein [Conexibacter sp. CPCC 206217]MDO8210332.1 SMP-30/gluconolactonase/LRE family protein [Conexibacter sp. CPCC 206217]
MGSARRISILEHPRCQLGEAPVWCPDDGGALYWADIFGCTIHRLAMDGAHRAWATPTRVGALALHADGGLVAGLKNGIHLLDADADVGGGEPSGGAAGGATAAAALRLLVDPEAELPDNRYNDCAVDAAGRLWIGSLDDTGVPGNGALHRLDADGTATTMVSGVGLANGLGFSPDGTRLYFTDTSARAIHVYDHDPDTGRLGARRLFARDADGDGLPDGLAVDAEGHVWSAKFGGGTVVRYRPDGAIERVQELPVSNPTSVAFGGAALDRLYITTASIDLDDPDELRRGAGQLLVHDDPGAAGLPARRCELRPAPVAPSPQSGDLHAA